MTEQALVRVTPIAPRQRTASDATSPSPLPELRLTAVLAFVVLADELHYGRAASRLFLTPSGLSRQISTIEKAVHTPLVLRTSRSVMLTAQGQALLPHAQAMLRNAEQALLAIAPPASPEP